jgi:hypothetical protein
MSDFWTWDQLMASNYDETLVSGVAARIHDPMWLLARQLKLGEFKHDGGATPVDVRIDAAYSRPSIVRGEGGRDGAPGAYKLRENPFEGVIEHEPIPSGPLDGLRQRKDGGLRLQRMLREAGLGAQAAVWATRIPFAYPRGTIDDETRAWFESVIGRVPDGRPLLPAVNRIRLGTDTTTPLVPGEREVLLAWWDGDGATTHAPRHNDNWDPTHLEYSVSAAAKVGAEEVILRAPEYLEGSLDWYAFDIGGESLGLGGHGDTATVHRVPVALDFAGMPSSRFWTFEDPTINFDALSLITRDQAPTTAAMMALEFALSYGDDWYLVPLPLDAHAVCRLNAVVITDCFGDQVTAQRPAGRWNLFRHDDDSAPDRLSTVAFHCSPAAASEGDVLEELHLLRDEQANLAWAIEAIVPHPVGGGRPPVLPQRPALSAAGAGLTWTLAPATVPRNWYPLVPVEAGQLQLGTMWNTRDVRPAGRILTELLPAPQRPAKLVHEEEVPIEGVQLTRRWQSARAVDGSLHFWLGRAKRPRQTEIAPALRFDVIDR